MVEMNLCGELGCNPECLSMIQMHSAKVEYLEVKRWIWSLIFCFVVVFMFRALRQVCRKYTDLLEWLSRVPEGSSVIRNDFCLFPLCLQQLSCWCAAVLRNRGVKARDHREGSGWWSYVFHDCTSSYAIGKKDFRSSSQHASHSWKCVRVHGVLGAGHRVRKEEEPGWEVWPSRLGKAACVCVRKRSTSHRIWEVLWHSRWTISSGGYLCFAIAEKRLTIVKV